ncbi:formate dehydrogenase accessory sulfurtransferase FdhD [Duganella sp. FT80W]|uniref:Sulfur carrier protein FdhD n=1 Tax=Duganella guangzhouensis TaxID=2666084 RepID=A0A6I2L6K6_9BURK|nr:formate dehydrogenase accessory sulfurtransferase FdhD [Duganella guangzhouensis]MRW92857.1 formate dehydrogenase accessory sulfurtransferase FdhD [Duganella guangzhouensis]
MKLDLESDKAGFQERPVLRHRGAGATRLTDSVIEEVPVALVFNGISHAVMMVTPRDLQPFAMGFALTEGLVAKASDIFDIEVREHARSFEIDITIASEDFVQLKQQRRSMAGRSGCGVCGIESLELLDLQPERITTAPLHAEGGLQPAIAIAVSQLGQYQDLMRATGGVHAAAWCDANGTVLRVCEDVGRHNALDKLIGHLALDGVDLQRGFVFMSSRASYELVRKAARMGISMLATISAPSTLAIDIAAEAGIKLVSFCRQDGCVEYT